MPNLGPTEILILLVPVCGFIVLAVLPVAAWIHIYRLGGQTRDMFFWAVIILLLPVAGPIAAFIFYKPNNAKADRV